MEMAWCEEFDVSTGEFSSSKEKDLISWSEAISNIVYELMIKDSKIVTITPAMIEGSKLGRIFRDFPNRSIDVGISEEHAFTMAGSMYLGGCHPYISIYSTFLQRSYDELCHDVARMNIPIVVGIDRAGIVGKDGDTHQGIFDVAFLKSIPNTVIAMRKIIMMQRNYTKLLLSIIICFFIRYPRGKIQIVSKQYNNDIYIGNGTLLSANQILILNIIVTGPIFDKVCEAFTNENMMLI